MNANTETRTLRAGMVGMGMIFDETYRPFFERAHHAGLHDRAFGDIDVQLTAVATRTGTRAEKYRQSAGQNIHQFQSFAGDGAVDRMLDAGVDFACVATPDDRHFEAAKKILEAGVHLLVEKPSVLKLQELDELVALAEARGVLAKAVYHKLLDPDHKKLRTLVHDGVLKHVNNGYCTLLEPKQISGSQFAEWITGRNPGTYVAVHYIKLIDFTFGGKLKTVTATGQRGLIGETSGKTWDSTQLRMIYEYDESPGNQPQGASPRFDAPGSTQPGASARRLIGTGREAAFDIHTSWVTPDNFPGYVEQEVQFRFDNGLWNGHSRKRGVECTVEGKTPHEMKISMNNHYNGTFLEPWGERSQRGYGIEVIDRFVRELASVEFGGPADDRGQRLEDVRLLAYNDLTSDRQTVATVQALEAILERQAAGEPDCVVRVNGPDGGLVLYRPGKTGPEVLYEPAV